MYKRYWGADRRRFQRLKVNLNVWYKVVSPLSARGITLGKEIEATTVDLSEGGVAIHTSLAIPEWTVLSVKLILYKTDKTGLINVLKPVEVLAEVRSSNLLENKEYRLGLFFKDINDNDKAAVANFINTSLRP